MDKQEKYELTITADSITSTDSRFTMNDLGLGDNYKPIDVSFFRADGEEIKRNYRKGERRNSNQTLPRLAFQIFENQIAALSVEDKHSFPVVRYRPVDEMICGIFRSIDEYEQIRNTRTRERMTYDYGNGKRFVIYSWNMFSTLYFVWECLKRFGEEGDKFVLTYRDKNKNEAEQEAAEENVTEKLEQEFKGYRNPYSQVLIESKNIIFRGAPGTGKSHLAKEIAADIVSNGYYDKYELLSPEQKKQVEFVQFHPSYDYSDFVEGLRPYVKNDNSIGFKRKDGVFMRFVNAARTNYENSRKSTETIEKEISAQEALDSFFSSIEFGVDIFKTINGNEFTITDVTDDHIYLSIPGNAIVNKLTLNIDELRKMLESGQRFDKRRDVTEFFGKKFSTQGYSYDYVLFKEIKSKTKKTSKPNAKPEELKKYIFIIDEINRGEISKIFGELFFSIDPGYRGESGAVSTQYANMHDDPDKKFYIPDNVFIIGTMNDIDRSVDTFDFAMRRRFRFIELKANDMVDMLADLDDEIREEAINRMTNLNKAIAETEDLNENYQIGAAYFLKLKKLSFEQLWTDYLEPMLLDYVQGMYNEKEIMSRFKAAYNNTNADAGNEDEDQG